VCVCACVCTRARAFREREFRVTRNYKSTKPRESFLLIYARSINPIRLCESTLWIMMPEIPEQCQLISRKVLNQTEFHCNVFKKILILAGVLNKKESIENNKLNKNENIENWKFY